MRSFGQVFTLTAWKEFFLSGFGLWPWNLHRTQSPHAKRPLVHIVKSYLTGLGTKMGLTVLSRGQNAPIYQGVVCCYKCLFVCLFFFGRGVRTWPETPPLLGHHHEVHHFYKSAEPVLVDHTWLQLVNTSPPHLHSIVLIREQKNIFRKLAVNYQQIQRSLTRLSTHQVQGRNNWPLQKIP